MMILFGTKVKFKVIKRHKNKSTPYPFYQQPFNSYEHILIFHKHRLDDTKYPCQICGSLNVSGNSYTELA